MVAIAGACTLALAGCGGDDAASSGTAASDKQGGPTVVATFSPLGAIVGELVGDAADVEVIVPNGQDPHDYSPSAKDVESLRDAALVVANGLDLEEGLADVIDEGVDEGVPTFLVTDHVELLDASEPGEHGPKDPHVWTDPQTMAQMVPALTTQLEAVLGVDLAQGEAAVLAELADDDEQIRATLSALPAGGCWLVTGHESLAYFAARYGCTVIGTVVPGLSSTAEASAQQVAELREAVEQAGVAAVFTEVGTPDDVVRQVADEAGVRVVELPTHGLEDEGDYSSLVLVIAQRIVEGLSAS